MPYKEVSCPDNVYLSKKDLINVIKNIQHAQDNDCKQPSANCDYLLNELSSGRMSYSDLMCNLDALNNQELKKQIRYSLAQLVNCKVKFEATDKSEKVGSYAWFRENIWGTTKIQRYIYLVSFLVCFLAIGYSIYRLLSKNIIGGILRTLNLPENLLSHGVSYLYLILFTIVFTIVAWTFSFMRKKQLEKPQTKGEETSKYLAKDCEYKISNQLESKLALAFYPILAGLFVMTFLTGGYVYNKGPTLPLGVSVTIMIVILTWLGFVFTFNLYYLFVAPQIILIAIILQRYILGSSSRFAGNEFTFIPKTIIVLAITIISIYFAYSERVKKPEGEKYTDRNIVSQTALMIGITIFLLWIYSFISSDYIDLKEGDKWTLSLFPLFKLFSSISSAGEVIINNYLTE